MRSWSDVRRSGSGYQETRIRFETLEPRNMLAADFGIVDAFDSSLIASIPNEVAVSQQMQVLRAHLNAGPQDSFELRSQEQDFLGFDHYRYQHVYNGLPVESSTFTVHARDGLIVSLSGEYHRVDGAATEASLDEATALQFALQYVDADRYLWQDAATQQAWHFHVEGDEHPAGHSDLDAEHDHHDHHGDISFEIPRADLVYVDNALAYKFDIYAVQPLSRSWVFVDAGTGEIAEIRDRIHHIDVAGTGTTLYDGNVNFTVDFNGAEYRLREAVPGVETYDANNIDGYSAATDITSSSTNFSDPDTHIGNQTHWGTEQTWDYFFTRHGRDSFDDQGTTLVSYVSFRNDYSNAFWNGSFMTYGDGNGTSRGPLVSLDIVGHEIAHGVTQFSAGLIYRDQSGALNESFSDIFGEAIENHARGSNDWLMGGDIGLNGNPGQFRSMANPNLHNDPDTYLGDYWYSGQGDNGGVHINSGVQNKWFYIMTNGESGTNDTGHTYNVTGVGIQDAASIAYRNLTQYLTPNSTYPDARVGAIQAAIDLFGVGSQQHLSTMAAWDAVGVYDLSLDLDLLAMESYGSQVYFDSAINDIAFDSDSDEFTLFLDENQSISLAVQNLNGDLLPHVTIAGPTGPMLTEVTATATTDVLLIQNLPVTTAGAYVLTIDGANGTSGFYQLDFQLNAALEEEQAGTDANDTPATAQDLDDSALTQGFLLTSPVDRLAVTGELVGGGSSVAAEDFETGVLDSAWTTSSSTSRGRIAVTSDTGTSDGAFALSMDVDVNGSFNLNEAIYTFDMTDVMMANLSFSHTSFGDETHLMPAMFSNSFNGDGVSISEDGTTWHTVLTGVTPPNGIWQDFEIDLVDFATNAGLTPGADFKVKFQQYDNFTRDSDGRAYDNISVGLIGNDYYTFTLDAGAHATIGVTQVVGNPDDIALELYDAAETLLFSGVAGPGLASYIENVVNTAATPETYYVNVVGGSALYNLVVTRGANLDLENGLDQDISDFQGVLGYVSDAVEVVADPDEFVSGTDVSGLFTGVTLSNGVTGGNIYAVESGFGAPTGSHVFGTSAGNDDGFFEAVNELRADFAELQAFVSIDTGSDDTLDIGFLRAYDADDNLLEEVFGSGVPHSGSETLAIQRTAADISYIIAGGSGDHTTPLDHLVYEREVVDTDVFEVQAVNGQQLDFQAYLPGDGPFEFDNRLEDAGGRNILLELLDPAGVSVATGSEVISHLATATGTWQLVVSAIDGAGEYYVAREINLVPKKFDFGPELSAVQVDWTQADGGDDYDPLEGYGWVGRKRALSMVEFTRGNALTGDGLSIASGTFVVDVDNGTYDVSLHFGFSLHLDSVRVTVEDTIHDLTPQANQIETWQVTVADGQLTLELSGNFGLDSLIRLAGLEIAEVSGSGLARQPQTPVTRGDLVSRVGSRLDTRASAELYTVQDSGPWYSQVGVVEILQEPLPQYLEPADPRDTRDAPLPPLQEPRSMRDDPLPGLQDSRDMKDDPLPPLQEPRDMRDDPPAEPRSKLLRYERVRTDVGQEPDIRGQLIAEVLDELAAL